MEFQTEHGASLKRNERKELSHPTEHAVEIHFLSLLRVALSRCCATQDISQCSRDPSPPPWRAATQSGTAAAVLVRSSTTPISPEWSSMRRKTADSVSSSTISNTLVKTVNLPSVQMVGGESPSLWWRGISITCHGYRGFDMCHLWHS